MRRFLFRLAGFFALQAALAVPVSLRMIRQPAYDSYLQANVRKHERLERLPSPRIVLVGGSATAFGVDSPRVEQALGIPVVNMGLYFPLGLDFMLNEIRGAIRPGDVVVVSPEYGVLFTDASASSLKQLVAVHPRALWWLEPSQIRGYIDQIHKPVGASARRALSEFFGGPEPAAKSDPPYSIESFNDYGDVVAHHGMRRSRISHGQIVSGSPDDPRFRKHLERLNRFERECASRGISCFYSYPPVVREGLEGHRARFDILIRALETDLHMAKLHGPEEMIFPAELFFDTSEHLGYEGKTKRTDILIKGLSTSLKQGRDRDYR